MVVGATQVNRFELLLLSFTFWVCAFVLQVLVYTPLMS